MGYSYGRNERGNMVLACDGCGKLGGVRKRTCPHTVLTDSSRGPRIRIPYCYPAALCSECYRTHKDTLHKDCAEGARLSQEKYDKTQAILDAGGFLRVAAWGSWHDKVPEGKTGVCFRNADGKEVHYLVDHDEYDKSMGQDVTPDWFTEPVLMDAI